MSYVGEEVVNGTLSDKWEYTSDGYDFVLWSTNATNTTSGEVYSVPVANGEVNSWTIYYHDYVPGSPSVDEFAPVEGSNCPPSSPPS
jgi:hypothetical protein